MSSGISARSFSFSPAEDARGPVPVAIEFAYGFTLDAAEVRPYFEYHKVRDGIFALTGDLFGYTIRPIEASASRVAPMPAAVRLNCCRG